MAAISKRSRTGTRTLAPSRVADDVVGDDLAHRRAFEQARVEQGVREQDVAGGGADRHADGGIGCAGAERDETARRVGRRAADQERQAVEGQRPVGGAVPGP